jgi:hypothetical protein
MAGIEQGSEGWPRIEGSDREPVGGAVAGHKRHHAAIAEDRIGADLAAQASSGTAWKVTQCW